MKQKYTLSIADMEINVITDESRETVELIVGMLDRKMREISLKSKRCSKNEAALLCALDFCSDKIKAKEQTDELEDALKDAEANVKALTEKLEYIEKNAEKAERERARFESENAKLRAMLDEARAGKTISDEDVASVTEEEEVKAPEVQIQTEAEEEAPKKKSKNRVGSMFELLTFSDI